MKKHLTLLLVIALTVGALPALTSAQEAPSLLLWVD